MQETVRRRESILGKLKLLQNQLNQVQNKSQEVENKQNTESSEQIKRDQTEKLVLIVLAKETDSQNKILKYQDGLKKVFVKENFKIQNLIQYNRLLKVWKMISDLEKHCQNPLILQSTDFFR